MNRRISVGVAVSLILVAITVTFTMTMVFSMRLFDGKVLSVKERAAMYNKLSEIDDAARSNLYFNIDEQTLYDSISKGYVEGLNDRDSVYLSQSQIQSRNAFMNGTEVSVGFDTEKNEGGYAVAVNVREGSSAAELGIIEGDVIVGVAGEDILENGYDDTVALLKGEPGTKVAVTYQRDGAEMEIELTRELIETAAVYYSGAISGVGYIRIKMFNNNTESQFQAALDAIMSASTGASAAQGLVIDLRDTHGGYNLDIAANIIAPMVPTGVIIRGAYADGSVKTLYTADERTVNLPVTVLVNERTVGFSELFAGVLGDYDNCEIVGTTTYGKGTLQRLSMLTDGSAVELTVAVLQTPVLGSYDRVGIVPDYSVESDGYVFSDSVPDTAADAQLRKAVEVLRSLAA